MIRICTKCNHITGQRRCVYCGTGKPGSNPVRSRGPQPRNEDSRQQERRSAFARALEVVSRKNLKPVLSHSGERVGWSGMSRRERRKLARAYAAGLVRRAAA